MQYTSPLKPENRVQSQPYSLSPLSPASQKLLQSPRKAARKIAKVPFKVSGFSSLNFPDHLYDLTFYFVGPGCSRIAGRFLPQSSRLVVAKCVERRPRRLRLLVGSRHQSSNPVMRPGS